MIKTSVFDPKNSKQKKAASRIQIITFISTFFIAELLPIFSSLILMILIPSCQTDKYSIVFTWLIFSTCITMFCSILVAVAFSIANGNKKVKTTLNHDNIEIIAKKYYEEAEVIIKYSDIKRVYVSIFTKLPFYEKNIGFYPIYCDHNAQIKNGEEVKSSKLMTSNIFFAVSKQEALEILEFLNSKIRCNTWKTGDGSLIDK